MSILGDVVSELTSYSGPVPVSGFLARGSIDAFTGTQSLESQRSSLE